jgi:hypothetical protein
MPRGVCLEDGERGNEREVYKGWERMCHKSNGMVFAFRHIETKSVATSNLGALVVVLHVTVWLDQIPRELWL